MKLLAVLFIAQRFIYTCTADPIMCKKCSDSHVTADDAFIEGALESGFDNDRNPDCRYNPADIESVTYCGHPARCSVTDAVYDLSTAMFTDYPVDVVLTLFYRDCLPPSADYLAEGCHNMADLWGFVTQAMHDQVTVHDISGTFCACNNSNCTKP